eukprot:gene26678-biopygen17140
MNSCHEEAVRGRNRAGIGFDSSSIPVANTPL